MLAKIFFVLILTLLTVVDVAQAQAGGRGVVVETNRKELDTILMRKPIPATEDPSARRATLEQINQDFKSLQELNNKLMSAVTAQGEVDYKSIASWVGEIKSKASRLKSNLVLPEATKEKQVKTENEVELKQQFLAFDKVIESFVTNPIFQNTNVVDVELAKKASNDLSKIIEESGKLKKAVARLAK